MPLDQEWFDAITTRQTMNTNAAVRSLHVLVRRRAASTRACRCSAETCTCKLERIWQVGKAWQSCCLPVSWKELQGIAWIHSLSCQLNTYGHALGSNYHRFCVWKMQLKCNGGRLVILSPSQSTLRLWFIGIIYLDAKSTSPSHTRPQIGLLSLLCCSLSISSSLSQAVLLSLSTLLEFLHICICRIAHGSCLAAHKCSANGRQDLPTWFYLTVLALPSHVRQHVMLTLYTDNNLDLDQPSLAAWVQTSAQPFEQCWCLES